MSMASNIKTPAQYRALLFLKSTFVVQSRCLLHYLVVQVLEDDRRVNFTSSY
jgi:hypothetical protein